MEGITNTSTTAGSNAGGFRRSRGVNWTEDETEQLLEAWADRDVQLLLENGPHNRQAFERVSFHLAQRQMDKTPSQCREKIKKLKTIYRNLNSGHGKVSRKIRGRLVQKLHQVMGGLSAGVTMPSAEKESPDLIVPSGTEGLDAGDDRQRSTTVLPDDFPAHFQASLGPSGDFMAEGSSGGTSDLSSSEDDEVEVPPARTAESSAPKNNNKVTKRSSRHRKNKSKRRSAVYVLIDKIIASQSAANERFAALEERRLLLDKELEEKRLEAEAKRQEAQRQHELRLLSTMAQQMACVLKSLNPVTFAGTRCEPVHPTVTVSSGSDPSKAHDSVVNGCGEYTTDATVYSSI